MNAIPLASGGTGATSASGAIANLLPGVASDGNNGIAVTGNVKAAEAIPALSPVCDIRSQGAVINNATPIDSAVQACVNIVNSVYGGTGTVLLPCVAARSAGGPGCFWNNPSALTLPVSGGVKFVLQGTVRVGSTLVAPYWENWFGDSGGAGNQFQAGMDGATSTIVGPSVNGTIGAAITTAPSTAVTITPTFAQGSIANLPPGSAITIAGTTSSTATAMRTLVYGDGQGGTEPVERDPHSARRTYYCHWLLGFIPRFHEQCGERVGLFRARRSPISRPMPRRLRPPAVR